MERDIILILTVNVNNNRYKKNKTKQNKKNQKKPEHNKVSLQIHNKLAVNETWFIKWFLWNNTLQIGGMGHREDFVIMFDPDCFFICLEGLNKIIVPK